MAERRPTPAQRRSPAGLPVLAAVALLLLAVCVTAGRPWLTAAVAAVQVLLVGGWFAAAGHPDSVAPQLLAVLVALVADAVLLRAGSGWGVPVAVLGLSLPVVLAVLLAGPDRTRVAERLTLTVAATASTVALATALVLQRRTGGHQALLAGLVGAAVALLAFAVLARTAAAVAAVVAVAAGALTAAGWAAAATGPGPGPARSAVIGAVAAAAALVAVAGAGRGVAAPPGRRHRPGASVLLAALLPVPLVTAGTAVAEALLR